MFPKSWLRQLLEMAVGLATVAWLLNWAWGLVRPLASVIVVVVAAVILVPIVVRRFRGW